MKVTLIIDPGNGKQERYEATSSGSLALPGVFQVVDSAVAVRHHEVAQVTAAMKVIADFTNAVRGAST